MFQWWFLLDFHDIMFVILALLLAWSCDLMQPVTMRVFNRMILFESGQNMYYCSLLYAVAYHPWCFTVISAPCVIPTYKLNNNGSKNTIWLSIAGISPVSNAQCLCLYRNSTFVCLDCSCVCVVQQICVVIIEAEKSTENEDFVFAPTVLTRQTN